MKNLEEFLNLLTVISMWWLYIMLTVCAGWTPTLSPSCQPDMQKFWIVKCGCGYLGCWKNYLSEILLSWRNVLHLNLYANFSIKHTFQNVAILTFFLCSEIKLPARTGRLFLQHPAALWLEVLLWGKKILVQVLTWTRQSHTLNLVALHPRRSDINRSAFIPRECKLSICNPGIPDEYGCNSSRKCFTRIVFTSPLDRFFFKLQSLICRVSDLYFTETKKSQLLLFGALYLSFSCNTNSLKGAEVSMGLGWGISWHAKFLAPTRLIVACCYCLLTHDSWDRNRGPCLHGFTL